jgi:hypothetical protein
MALGHWFRAVCAFATVAFLMGCDSFAPSSRASNSLIDNKLQTAKVSWMEPAAKKETLLYVSLVALSEVNVYSYPARQLVGQISGFRSPNGLCSDKAGHIFVSDYQAQTVYEYAHGGTQPIATFRPKTTPEYSPVSCSVDPGSENLAVEAADVHYVFVFKHEGQAATVYMNPYAQGDFCTYDDGGNFFARGTKNHIAELTKGSSKFKNIPLSRSIEDLVGFAWDGKYLSIATNDSTYTVVDYRIRVHASKATIISSRDVTDAKEIFQFTIYDHQFIGPDLHASQVTFWKYPSFGNPVGAIEGLTEPVGTAISVAR